MRYNKNQPFAVLGIGEYHISKKRSVANLQTALRLLYEMFSKNGQATLVDRSGGVVFVFDKSRNDIRVRWNVREYD